MSNKGQQKVKLAYQTAKEKKVGETAICPSCDTEFIKSNYQQAFCKSKLGTICKDKYWNRVTPTKRNNTTRISPASAEFMASNSEKFARRTSEGYIVIDGTAYDEFYEPIYSVDWADDDRHPFDLED